MNKQESYEALIEQILTRSSKLQNEDVIKICVGKGYWKTL